MSGVLQMRVVNGQTYLMEHLGGLEKITSHVGLRFSPERPLNVAMTPALTNPHKRGCGKAGEAKEGKLNLSGDLLLTGLTEPQNQLR